MYVLKLKKPLGENSMAFCFDSYVDGYDASKVIGFGAKAQREFDALRLPKSTASIIVCGNCALVF
jgi:hypothetical protein